MSAFAAAMATLVADPNMAVDAVHRRANRMTATALRVVRSMPDQVLPGLGSASFRSGTDVLVVPCAALPLAPAQGDTFVIGILVLKVLDAEADATGSSWRVTCDR